MRWLTPCLALLLCGTLPTEETAAQEPIIQEPAADQVAYMGLTAEVDPWDPQIPVLLTGEVKQLDGDRLALLESDGSPRTVPSAQIVSIAPRWRTAAAAEAHTLFVERKYKAVVAAVPTALKSDLVQWQQRLLIAELVQSVEALGETRLAGNYFLSLAKSNPPQMLYADIPLCWTVAQPDEALIAEAHKWLLDENESAQLLGASWLLLSEPGSQAKPVLGQLRSSKNSAIAQLATLQGWRLTPPPQTMSELTRWLEYRDRLIPPLQLGPTEFIADRLMRIGRTDLALGQWMRIASQHADHPHRCAQALKAAAAQLQRAGRAEEAQRLEPWINSLSPTN
jgi:hypothetical protein